MSIHTETFLRGPMSSDETVSLGIRHLMIYALLPVVAWSSWYYYTFHWRYRLFSSPRPLPYLVPIIGNVRAFMKDSNVLFTNARTYFGNTRQPFCLTVMGEELYIVTSSEDVSAVYKNTKVLDFDPFIHNVTMAFGATRENADKMLGMASTSTETELTEATSKDYGRSKSFIEQSHDNYKLQLHPGPKLDELQAAFLDRIDAHLHFDHISRRITPFSRESQRKVVSLFDWTSEVLLYAATRAFFGDTLLDEIQPDLLDSFFVFDDESWKLNYQYPRLAAKKMYAAKDKATTAFERYFSLPRSSRPGAAWVIMTLEDDMRSLGMDTQQIASMIFMIYWVVNANAYKLAFWIIAHILYDPALLVQLREEVAPCFSPSPSPHSAKITSLTQLFDSTPILSSLYHEGLRVYNAPMGARSVTRPCSLPSAPSVILQPGKKLLMPYRQLHYDPAVWGKDIDAFDPTRFLGPSGEKLKSRNTSFRPFGGGSTYCPGRFLAWREIALFVACVVWRFDITLVDDGTEFPVVDERKPTGGMMGPVEGKKGEVLIEVRPRVAG